MRLAYWIVLILLALIWGQLERRQRRCPLDDLSRNAEKGKAFHFWAKSQALVLWPVLGMFAVAFLLFTWKMALVAMLVWFAAQHLVANLWPPKRLADSQPDYRDVAAPPETKQD